MIAVAVALWLLTALALAVGLWALRVEPTRLQVLELEVPLPRLPEALRGLRVGHISDTHLGTARAARLAEQAAAQLQACEPDLICFTGDVVNDADYLSAGVELLRGLHAPLGVFLVLGNHDCNATLEDFLYGEPMGEVAEQAWKRALAGTGVRFLDNEAASVAHRGCALQLAGIGDVSAGRDDLEQALAGEPRGELQLLLSHSPDALDLPRAGWADLLLAGHTHGGQFQVPGLGSVWAPVWRWRHRASGLLRLNHTVAFVNRGVGAGIPARLNCPPQVAVLTLVPGPHDHLPETPAPAHAQEQA